MEQQGDKMFGFDLKDKLIPILIVGFLVLVFNNKLSVVSEFIKSLANEPPIFIQSFIVKFPFLGTDIIGIPIWFALIVFAILYFIG